MKIAIIDCDSVAFSIGQGNKVLDEQGNPIKIKSEKGNMVFQYKEKTEEELQASADYYMTKLLTDGGFTDYIGYIKGNDTTTLRKLVNPSYKANRGQVPPTWWNFVKQDLINRWGVTEIHNMESDDACNITQLHYKDSYICAIDGDLLRLEGTHYNWRAGEWVTTTKEEAAYKFWSDMVTGQPGDNVKGLPKRGEAFVKALFEKQPSHSYSLRQVVFDAYVKDLGEYRGIDEFHKNYISLKILDYYEGFNIARPINTIDKLKEIQTNKLFK